MIVNGTIEWIERYQKTMNATEKSNDIQPNWGFDTLSQGLSIPWGGGSGLWHGMDELWTVIWMHVLMDSFEADQNWASMQHSNGTSDQILTPKNKNTKAIKIIQKINRQSLKLNKGIFIKMNCNSLKITKKNFVRYKQKKNCSTEINA